MSNFSGKFITVSAPSPHVLLLALNRRPVNAVNVAMWEEYCQIIQNICDCGADIRAIVISSAVPTIFTAGIDLQDATWGPSTDPSRGGFELRKIIEVRQEWASAPARAPFPVIAAVHGPVIGLGVDLISHCDIRYAASNATFCIKEADVGLAADIGTLALLGKITGNESLVRELVYTGRSFSADEARRLGFISAVVDGGRDDVVRAALELARTIASKSPIAVHGSKVLISHGRDHSVAETMHFTTTWNAMMLQTPDTKEALTALVEKRPPRFGSLKPSKARL